MSFDLICVGGGVAGGSLARTMAMAGAKVLVLEREKRFRDRVRGEQLQPWGVAEAQRLGLCQLLAEAGGVEVRWWANHRAGHGARERRDLVASGPHRLPGLNMHHSDLQEAILGAAEAAGATVLRGALATALLPGRLPSVSYRLGGAERRSSGRLIVGADGRGSRARAWAGNAVRTGPKRLMLAGQLLTGMAVEPPVVNVHYDFAFGRMAMVAEVGGGRQRVYLGFPCENWSVGAPLLAGRGAKTPARLETEAFKRLVLATGATDYGLEGAIPAGPLAVFDGAESWVEAAFGSGVVLIGDAAAVSDPNFGCGLALCLRDVRVLTDELQAADDPLAGASAYAARQRDYAATLRRLVDWLTSLYRTPGEAADRLREQLLPLFEREPWRVPDLVGAGPDAAADPQARALLFGEDVHGPNWHGLGPWRP